MKKTLSILLFSASLMLIFTACARQSASPTWQDQYDLGVHYLSEGNYQEAIIAFTVAIEIDPKRAEAYDKLADAYLAAGDTEAAMAALRQGYEATGDGALYSRQQELEQSVEPSLSPTLEPIPEATAEIKYNAYGATEFALRDTYIAFEDVPVEEQQFIESVVNAVVVQDAEELQNILKNIVTLRGFFSYTTSFGGYKVEIQVHGNAGAAENVVGFMSVEIRTQSEMGYCCDVGYSDNRSEYNITLCPCRDWQYNGEMISRKTESDKNGDRWIETTGLLVNNLRSGTFIETGILYTQGYELGHTRTRKYVDGVEIEAEIIHYENGIETSRGQESVDSSLICSIARTDYTSVPKQSMLDDLYW